MARNNQKTSSIASNLSSGTSNPSRSRNGSGRQAASGGGAAASRTTGGGGSPGARSRGGSSRGSAGGAGGAGNGGARAIGSRAVASVREHPIPASIIGAGLAWLALESTGIISTGVGRRTASTLGELGGTFGESFTGAAKSTRKTVRRGAGSVAGTVGSAVKGGASAVGRGAKQGFVAGRDAVVHTIENHPVAVCSAALAAGVITGMMLPTTLREARLMGKRSARLVDDARRTGSELLEQGKDLAEAAVDSVHRGQRRAAGGSKTRRSASASR